MFTAKIFFLSVMATFLIKLMNDICQIAISNEIKKNKNPAIIALGIRADAEKRKSINEKI